MKNSLKWLGVVAVLGFAAMLMVKIPALGFAEARFCGQCHAMDFQVETYQHSSHARDANCGDCHDPHGLVIGSAFAAYTGARDVYRVVTDTTPAEVRTTNLSKKVLQDNCLRCHGDFMEDIGDTSQNGGKYCFDCHQTIVHPK